MMYVCVHTLHACYTYIYILNLLLIPFDPENADMACWILAKHFAERFYLTMLYVASYYRD